jgi:hypothetical protein
MKKKYLVYGAIATIGAVLYYFWKKDKDDRDREAQEKLDVQSGTPRTDVANNANNSNLSSASNTTTQAQIELATAYRKWANSTEELKKKWGKTSKYDLDETSTSPYNSFFLDSYNGGGKAEYEKSLQSTGSSSTGTSSSTLETQAKLNKETMDRLYAYWNWNRSAKTSSSSTGRELQLFFEVSGEYFMSYKWSIIFFENKSGSSKPTYAITDGAGKLYQRGYFSFDGNVYTFRATQGTGIDRRTTQKSLAKAINILTDRTSSWV